MKKSELPQEGGAVSDEFRNKVDRDIILSKVESSIRNNRVVVGLQEVFLLTSSYEVLSSDLGCGFSLMAWAVASEDVDLQERLTAVAHVKYADEEDKMHNIFNCEKEDVNQALEFMIGMVNPDCEYDKDIANNLWNVPTLHKFGQDECLRNPLMRKMERISEAIRYLERSPALYRNYDRSEGGKVEDNVFSSLEMKLRTGVCVPQIINGLTKKGSLGALT